MNNLFISASQVLNTLMCGYTSETLSSRSYRHRNEFPFDFAYIAINKLFFWEDDHCKNAHRFELNRHKNMLRILEKTE